MKLWLSSIDLRSGLRVPRLALLIALVSLLTSAALPAAERHTLYTDLLQEHVVDGWVNYTALKNDPRLERYLAQLAATNPAELPNDDERVAYWLNVYNAFTLKLIADNMPLESISELHLFGSVYLGVLFGETIWQNYEFPLHNGKLYTLDHVEHSILRPIYKDYRHHAAFVCAAVSCPPLRSEAYEAARLSEQLDDQMRVWLKTRKWNYYDPANQKLYISSIFNWFEDDFLQDEENAEKEIVDVLLPYFAPEVQQQIRADRDRLRVKYLTYDWALNGE
ncbi:MAG: DUF547 domain-containing protein [bacterium]|nr:DUF547 domain-containing protein [bacterium]